MLRFLCAAGLVVLSGAASAQPASCPPGVGQELSGPEISSLLSGRYAYGTQYDGQYYNLLHAFGGVGNVTDYKRGPSDPKDKSTVVGTYAIGTVGNSAVVTYTYGSFSYSYSISPKPIGNNPPAPGQFVFCQRAGTAPNNVNQGLSVMISGSHGPVQP